MKDWKILLIAFLVGISGYSVYRYVSLAAEKEAVIKVLDETKERLVSLEQEKQNLLRSIEKEERMSGLFKENLFAGRRKISRLWAENLRQKEELELDIAVLRAENSAIREQEDKLRLELSMANKEKDDLIAKFNSAGELRKALSELRSKRRKDKASVKKKTDRPKDKMFVEMIMEGNKGFLIKDGKQISFKNIKIEVNPVIDSNH